MKVVVKMFAGARELSGEDQIELELPPGAKYGALRAKLQAALPQLKPICERALFASDSRYVSDEDQVSQTQEIALIPPVSGG